MDEQAIITSGDNLIELEIQFRDNKKKPIDITDCEIEITFVPPTSPKFTEEGAISNSLSGISSFMLTEKHTTEEGLWTCYFAVLDSNGYVTAQESVYYFIIPKHGGK